MLTYNNGRFYCGNASFALPNGCKLVTDGTYCQENGVAIRPQDERFTIEIDFLHRGDDLGTELMRVVETGYQMRGIAEPAPVRYAHAEGWEITYPNSKLFTHEIWLEVNKSYDFGEDEPLNVLALLITSEECSDIEEIKGTPLFRELVDGICADKCHESN